jgi:hypothetical protein
MSAEDIAKAFCGHYYQVQAPALFLCNIIVLSLSYLAHALQVLAKL